MEWHTEQCEHIKYRSKINIIYKHLLEMIIRHHLISTIVTIGVQIVDSAGYRYNRNECVSICMLCA